MGALFQGDHLGTVQQGALGAGVQVAEGAVAFLAFLVLALFIRRVLRRALAGRQVRADAALLTERAAYATLVGLGVFMFVAIALGSAAAGLTGLLVAAFVTSLGLQDLFKNYVAGFYVLLERNVRVGTLVRTDGFRGVVTEIRMRTTYLRGQDGEQVVVPNSALFNGTVAVAEAPPDWARPAPPEPGPEAAASVEGARDDPRQRA